MGRDDKITIDLHVPLEIGPFLCVKGIAFLQDGWHVFLSEMRYDSGINLLLRDTTE
jgi:hypothetical protein